MSWDPGNGIYMDDRYNLHYREVFHHILTLVIPHQPGSHPSGWSTEGSARGSE